MQMYIWSTEYTKYTALILQCNQSIYEASAVWGREFEFSETMSLETQRKFDIKNTVNMVDIHCDFTNSHNWSILIASESL